MALKVYVDNDVLSGRRKRDLKPQENEALDRLVELRRQGRVIFFVSDLHSRDAAALPDAVRREQESIIESWQHVEFVQDHHFYGPYRNDYSGSHVVPLVADDPDVRKLQDLGLERNDAHHIMLALRSACGAFLTCDEKTILNRRVAVEAMFPIKLVLPSELVQRRLWE